MSGGEGESLSRECKGTFIVEGTCVEGVFFAHSCHTHSIL